jgi:hypothetical protein
MTAMTAEQIRESGLTALKRELGAVGMVRFLQQFETGKGDYSTERSALLGVETVQSLAHQLHNPNKED